MKSVDWFNPERVYLFDHDGQRWFTDSYSMVPVRQWSDALPDTPGEHRLDSDWDEDGEWLVGDYRPVKADWDKSIATKLWADKIDRNADRKGAQLLMWPQERDPQVIVYEKHREVLLNRLYLETSAYIANRKIDGLGLPENPLKMVTLYAGDEVAGYMMPVRGSSATSRGGLIPLEPVDA